MRDETFKRSDLLLFGLALLVFVLCLLGLHGCSKPPPPAAVAAPVMEILPTAPEPEAVAPAPIVVPLPPPGDSLGFRLRLEVAWIQEYLDPENDRYDDAAKLAKIRERLSNITRLAAEADALESAAGCPVEAPHAATERGGPGMVATVKEFWTAEGGSR
jgi:hypothetical protein